jgi:hypothetical protein
MAVDTLEKTLQENIEYYRLQEQQALAALTGLPRGSIKTKVSKGRTYYYLQFRHQGKVVQKYLGRRYPAELAEQIDRRGTIRAQLREVRRALKLLRQRQNNDLLQPIEEIVTALAREGLWEAGAEIVGSWCFRIYQQFLGVSVYPVRTDDLDILVPLPWRGRAVDLAELLRCMGFVERITPDESTVYHRPGIRVEFLSAARGRAAGKAAPARGLGVRSQPLRFMDLLLDNPLSVKIMAGVTVRVPAPTAFLLHKLLICLRRTKEHKRVKDMAQAIAVARFVLGSDAERGKLQDAWRTLLPSWRERVFKAIGQARRAHPLEDGVLDALQTFLSSG